MLIGPVSALALQAATGAEPARPVIHNYLKGAESRRPCDEQPESSEIVVCGRPRDNESYRLHPIDEQTYAEPPVRAEVGLGDGVTLKAALIQKRLQPGDAQSQPDQPPIRYAKQIRVTLTIPLPAIK